MDPPEHTDSPLSASLLPRDSSDRKATNRHKFRTGAKDLFVCILSFKNAASIATGPIVAISLWRFLHIGSDDTGRAAAMVAVISWVFIWWMTEAIPIAVTSLAPLFLLPVMQIQTASEVSKSYMNDTVFLLIGSFMLATAIEHYDLHRRMAMKLLTLLGGKLMDPWLLLLGFCVGPGFVSMWVHNTAAAVMMMPVGLGVLEKAMSTISQVTDEEMEVGEKRQDEGEDFSAAFLGTMEARGKEVEKMHVTRFAKAVVLAIGYAATIGGMATLTGTGVNLILAGLYESYFPEAEQITYLQWMMFGLPMACLLLVFLWLLLCVWFCPRSSVPSIARSLQDSHVLHDIASMGPISFAEIAILGVFGILILLWLTRSMGDFGGWSDLFNDYVGNGSVSVSFSSDCFSTLVFLNLIMCTVSLSQC
ncbi:hypothetical protein KP509_1Z053900 [Ceratopteris richardii]|nr:hypothetical protein KP509_1Z053900 [Ceratopteris richardii]